MNKSGFTLIEMLACIGVLGIILVMGIITSKGTLSTSLTQLRILSNNEIIASARSYAISEDVTFENGYACVTVEELINLGYLEYTNDEEVRNKKIEIIKNDTTKVIETIKYTQSCR